MINFHSVRWKNFLSTGNQFIEVKLDRSPTTLIIGENGAGKSTILDALCFSLFGKPFRSINKQQLVNSVNVKHAIVEIEFETQNKKCKVIRGIKPNLFEVYVDGKMINQDASARDYQKYLEENILKLNYKSFTQVVILGSSTFVPFMQLSAKARREVVEDILDIRIFSLMNTILKIKNKEIQNSIEENENKIDVINEKIELSKKYIHDVITNRENTIKELQKEIDELESKIIEANGLIETNQKTHGKLLEQIVAKDSLSEKLKKYSNMKHTIDLKLRQENQQVAFFHDNDSCPTCNQNIDQEFRTKQIQTKEEKIGEFGDAIEKLEDLISKAERKENKIKEIVRHIQNLETQISIQQTRIEGYEKTIKDSQIKINALNEEIISNDQQKKLEKQLLKKELMENRRLELSENRSYYDVVKNLLQDSGIKTKIVKQYLPIMNKYINSYLGSMDFFCNFNIDENFNETIKSRHRDEFTYASFSEGEKMRIDLSLLFTWRQIARMKNSTNTNLLILDEIFDSSLDGTGTDDFLKILNTFENQNVFVISHKGDILYDKFRSVIKFEKNNNFSRMV